MATNVHLVKAMVFPIVMYGCESWTIKKDGCWGNDYFELCCWRRLLRFLWRAGRSNQSILKEINSEYSFGGTDAEAKAPILWSHDVKSRAESLEKTLMLGKIEGPRRRGWQRMKWHHWLNRNEFEQAPGDGEVPSIEVIARGILAGYQKPLFKHSKSLSCLSLSPKWSYSLVSCKFEVKYHYPIYS